MGAKACGALLNIKGAGKGKKPLRELALSERIQLMEKPGEKIRTLFKERKKTTAVSIAVLAVLAAAVFGAFGVITYGVNQYMDEVIEDNIRGMNRRSTIAMREKIDSRINTLSLLAEKAAGVDSAAKAREVLEPYVERYRLYKMIMIFPDGTHWVSDGTLRHDQGEAFYAPCFQGENVVTKAYPSKIGEQMVNYIGVPVWKEGKVWCALVASYESGDFAEIMNMGMFFEDAMTIVLDEKGKCITDLSRSADQTYRGVLEAINDNESILPPKIMKTKGYFSFSYENVKYVAYMTELGYNDWYLMSFFRWDTATAAVQDVKNFVSFVTLILLGLLTAALGLLIRMFGRYQKKINRIVFEDTLTGKKNYPYLRQSAEEWRGFSSKTLAAIDINDFNMINSAFGTQTGDKLLRYLDEVFERVLPEDRLYRDHSDLFIAVLETDSKEAAERKIQAFLGRIEEDIAKERIEPFTVSAGLCLLKECSGIHEAYTNGVIAKDMARRQKKAYGFFDRKLREIQVRNLSMVNSFEHGVAKGEFHAYYQPKYDMRSGEIIGAEALVRWKRDGEGMVSPGEFIPCFEESGKIILLDEIMIEMVCRQMNQLRAGKIDFPRVSVNLSRWHLKQPHYIIGRIRRLMETYQIEAGKLSFEITETAMYENGEGVRALAEALRGMDCRVELDDYGSGMSGLQSFFRTDFDTIKLDGGFIRNYEKEKVKTLIEHTIRMVEDLGMDLIVEGVETREQVDFLLARGCYFAQGYFYAKPMPWESYKRLLAYKEKA